MNAMLMITVVMFFTILVGLLFLLLGKNIKDYAKGKHKWY